MENSISQRHGGTESLARFVDTVLSSVSPCLCERYLMVAFTVLVFTFSACSSKQALKDSPIITSATHQHTLYNGSAQPIEAETAKEDAPPRIVTYFHSEADLHADRDGASDAPVEVGVYYVRIRRPAGNGYRAGPDITVEYHIQRGFRNE